MHDQQQLAAILTELLQLLDIPESYYEKAVARYKSMSAHFHRQDSSIAHLNPTVYPQGSFRLGTVIRPLHSGEGYDLDLVCRIAGSKAAHAQKDVKELLGKEVKSYSRAQGFKEEPTEGRRCWKQEYQDEVGFHMDVLPSIPNDPSVNLLLENAGVESVMAREALAITDTTHRDYALISPHWPRSNPKGYAIWFDRRMDVGGSAGAAKEVIFKHQVTLVYASVDDVPAYRLKTPLQQAIQLLKRHRDQLFREDPEGKPISIIITTLAARAYQGETDVAAALTGILLRMDRFVRSTKPRIPNQVDPEEDFADRWTPELEDNFWRWLRQAREDFEVLSRPFLTRGKLEDFIRESFDLRLPPASLSAMAAFFIGAPNVLSGRENHLTQIPRNAQRPWGTA